jgi:hypothetical protein
MERHEQRCSVCGTLLYYTTSDRNIGAVFCPDRLCIVYPPTTTSRAADPTLPGLCMAILESTSTTGAQLSRALGKNPNSYAGVLMTQSRKRWRDVT